MFLLQCFLNLFGLVICKKQIYEELINLRDNPKIIPLYGPPNKKESETEKVKITVNLKDNGLFLVATISNSPCYTNIHREEDFVTYFQNLLNTYSLTILTEAQRSQLRSCYRVKSNVTYTIKVKGGKEEISLDIKYWK